MLAGPLSFRSRATDRQIVNSDILRKKDKTFEIAIITRLLKVTLSSQFNPNIPQLPP